MWQMFLNEGKEEEDTGDTVSNRFSSEMTFIRSGLS